MLRKKITLVALLVLFIQFIQPNYNKSEKILPTDITQKYVVLDNVQTILHTACYDCHSNNTRYPWYSYIQPIGWVLANHVHNGKQKLNFSEFGTYSTRRQINKLKAIANQIKDDEMPISSYKMIHKAANLTKEDKLLVQGWMNKTADSLLLNN